jgi:hypothetical protein
MSSLLAAPLENGEIKIDTTEGQIVFKIGGICSIPDVSLEITQLDRSRRVTTLWVQHCFRIANCDYAYHIDAQVRITEYPWARGLVANIRRVFACCGMDFSCSEPVGDVSVIGDIYECRIFCEEKILQIPRGPYTIIRDKYPAGRERFTLCD